MSAKQPSPQPVLQLRLVVEAEDYDDAVAFYRDVLGLTEEEAYQGEGGAKVSILDAGRATLEIANPAQKQMIDEVEVGRPVAGKYRVAFEVEDTPKATEKLVDAGATLVAPPTETPWRSLNARLDAPAGTPHHLVPGAGGGVELRAQSTARQLMLGDFGWIQVVPHLDGT